MTTTTSIDRIIPTSIIGVVTQLRLPPPSIIRLNNGTEAMVRSRVIDDTVKEAFWKAWRFNRLDFARGGLSVTRKGDGPWMCAQWLTPRGELTPMGKEILTRLQESQKEEAEWVHTMETWEPPVSLPPEIEAKLYEYQRKPARQILHALLTNGGAWDTSDMGTGKTFMGLAAAIATGLKIGVVCPFSVKSAWEGAFKHFGKRALFIDNYESLRTGNRRWVRKFGERLTWEVEPDDTVLILDEAHRCKNPTALSTKLLLGAVREKIKVLCASGTMATTVTEMYATGQVVGLHDGTEHGWTSFLMRNGVKKNGSSYDVDKRLMSKGLVVINKKIFPRLGARVRIQDLGDRFPDTQILCQAFSLSDEATKRISDAYARAQSVLDRLISQGEAAAANQQQQGLWIKAYHEAEREKIPGVIDLAQEHLDNGRSVVIFVNFDDTRQMVMEAFKTKCAIFGGQNGRERDKHIAAFQADESRVIVANLCAGGVGVSLHDKIGDYPRTAIILPNPRASEMKQAMGRVHRAGGVTKSLQIVFWTSGTVEEGICHSVRNKLANLANLNDGVMTPPKAF